MAFDLKEFFFGKRGGIERIPTMIPEQQQLLSQLLGGLGGPGGALGAGLGGLQQLLSGAPGAFEQFEAPFQRQFQEQTIPGIAERFTGMGAGGQRSAAFGQQLGQAGAGLSESLAALRGGLQQQALGQLPGLLGMGMGARPFEQVYRPGTQGLLGGMAPGIGQAGGLGLLKLLGLF